MVYFSNTHNSNFFQFQNTSDERKVINVMAFHWCLKNIHKYGIHLEAQVTTKYTGALGTRIACTMRSTVK